MVHSTGSGGLQASMTNRGAVSVVVGPLTWKAPKGDMGMERKVGLRVA